MINNATICIHKSKFTVRRTSNDASFNTCLCKFMYSEKATKIWWTLQTCFNSTRWFQKIRQILAVFREYFKFTTVWCITKHYWSSPLYVIQIAKWTTWISNLSSAHILPHHQALKSNLKTCCRCQLTPKVFVTLYQSPGEDFDSGGDNNNRLSNCLSVRFYIPKNFRGGG